MTETPSGTKVSQMKKVDTFIFATPSISEKLNGCFVTEKKTISEWLSEWFCQVVCLVDESGFQTD